MSYIDNIFLRWQGGTCDFVVFVDFLNGMLLGILFNLGIYNSTFIFPYVCIIDNNGAMAMLVFDKVTNMNMLVHYIL